MKPLTFVTPPQRILIIKPSSLGDVTHALPVLNALRRRWPAAQISWLVSTACAGLLEDRKGLDEVILFDRKRFGTAWRNPAAGLDLIRLKRDLWRRSFDLVIDLQGLFRSAWLAWLTRAPVRIGFANARELAWAFYTHRVPMQTMEQHAVDRYMKVAAALGCETQPVEFGLVAREDDRRYIESLIAPGDRFAVLIPGATWPTKCWPAEQFAALVGPLRERFGLGSVVAGAADAAELGARIVRALNLVGKTNLRQLVALLERADLVIANDSGPMHIAAALGRPLVAIFGPTNPVRTGPYGRPECVVRADARCAPCYRRRCGDMRCMRELAAEMVLETAARQLKQSRAPGQLEARATERG